MLSEDEQNLLLKGFPNVELSYETIVHNKVQNADYILVIPEGINYFAWFTNFKKQNVCVLMEINSNKKIKFLKIVHCCFHDKIAFGTIFYGTVFKYNNFSFFSVENLLYYKGSECFEKSFEWKLNSLISIFSTEIKQEAFTTQSIIFGLPLISNAISNTINNLIKEIPLLPYKIKYLQFRCKNKTQGNYCFNLEYKPDILSNYQTPNQSANQIPNQNQTQNKFSNNLKENKQIVFQIKPDIQNDIYHLFTYNNKPEYNYYNVACIPDYKTSVMMNNLFRKIKENKNLDALEESDDEEEFENLKEDKFVYLDNTFNMVCQYNYKFKKWYPVRLAKQNEKVNSIDEVIRLEKNNK